MSSFLPPFDDLPFCSPFAALLLIFAVPGGAWIFCLVAGLLPIPRRSCPGSDGLWMEEGKKKTAPFFKKLSF
jgi:hypothetical protein